MMLHHLLHELHHQMVLHHLLHELDQIKMMQHHLLHGRARGGLLMLLMMLSSCRRMERLQAACAMRHDAPQ